MPQNTESSAQHLQSRTVFPGIGCIWDFGNSLYYLINQSLVLFCSHFVLTRSIKDIPVLFTHLCLADIRPQEGQSGVKERVPIRYVPVFEIAHLEVNQNIGYEKLFFLWFFKKYLDLRK